MTLPFLCRELWTPQSVLYWELSFVPMVLQAWSITYHSWLTFVLLIWSCTLWMIRNRRKYAMISSPFMVVYANLLLVLQYIWSFELTEIKKVPGFLEKKNPGELASKVNKQGDRKERPAIMISITESKISWKWPLNDLGKKIPEA